jgi:hypothetical protein
MKVINIAKDFSPVLGARNYADGSFTGEQFFDQLLRPKYIEATESNEKLKIILDGTEGMASSFINEAFRRLGNEFGADNVWQNLLLVSDEAPRYIVKIKDAIYGKKK